MLENRSFRRFIPTFAAIALFAFGAALLCSPAQAQRDQGDFKLRYMPAGEDPNLKDARSIVVQSGIFDEIIDFLNGLLSLPHDIEIRFENNEQGPYYLDGTIIMNYQFVVYHAGLFEYVEYSESAEQLVDDLLGITEFVFYHEIAHALIDAYDIPVLGREEDAADDLATLMAAHMELGDIALIAADAFDISAELSGEFAESQFWDEHSLGEQRMYSLVCLVFGSDPEAYADLAEEFPEHKAQRCIYDFQQKSDSWDKVLEPWSK